MPDLIKFKCKACGKKMAVKPEHAGRKARCSGCDQRFRVPSPGKQVATAATAKAKQPASPEEPDIASLYALADMEQQSAIEEPVAQPMQPSYATNGTGCPGCGAEVKPGAKICVQCGHNFASGKKLKTKKSKERDHQPVVSSFSNSPSSSGASNFFSGAMFKFGAASLIIGALGVGIMTGAVDPSSESSGGGRGKHRAAAKLINATFEALGPYGTGGILLVIALFLGMIALSSRD